ncbi:MAG: helix-turn-helix domain-containing protein [Saprospiraceae bacterium]
MLLKSIAISGLMALAGSVFLKSTGVEEKKIDQSVRKAKIETLGKQINIARQIRKMTINDLARSLDINASQLTSIEQGKIKPVKEIVFKAEEILKTTFVSDEIYYANKP